jgi:hypothetical protein
MRFEERAGGAVAPPPSPQAPLPTPFRGTRKAGPSTPDFLVQG